MRRVLLGAALAAAAGCAEPTPPGRGAAFSFADTAAGRALVFHWIAAELPVRYHAQAAALFPDLVRRAVATWEAQFLYGEFRGVLVPDAAQADVVVRFADAPPAPAEPDHTTSPVPACDGVTSLAFNATNDTIERPLVVEVDWLGGYSPGQVWACVERVVTHELGHTLGLINQAHAGTVADDLMYPAPQVVVPGPGDRATVEVLYHTPRTVAPGPR